MESAEVIRLDTDEEEAIVSSTSYQLQEKDGDFVEEQEEVGYVSGQNEDTFKITPEKCDLTEERP